MLDAYKRVANGKQTKNVAVKILIKKSSLTWGNTKKKDKIKQNKNKLRVKKPVLF